MSDNIEMFLATFRPHHDGGRLSVDILPIDSKGIRTDLRKRHMEVTLDRFEVDAVREYLPTVGLTLVRNHPVGHGKDFFFDMCLERVTSCVSR